MRRVDFPCEGALAADPSRHAAVGEQGRGCRSDRAGEHVHIADETQVVGAGRRVQPVFEDQVYEEDGIRRAGRVLPDELNEETVVVRGEDSVREHARHRRRRVLLGDHVVERHVGRMPDAEIVFAEETGQRERRGGGGNRIRRGGRGGGEGRQRRVDGDLDLHVGVGSRFQRAGGQQRGEQAEGPGARRGLHRVGIILEKKSPVRADGASSIKPGRFSRCRSPCCRR